jgi:signal transduction histidine kinase
MIEGRTSFHLTLANRVRETQLSLRTKWPWLQKYMSDKVIPGHLINCLTAFALGVLYLCVAFSIVPDDVARIEQLFGPQWVPAHLIFRSICCAAGIVIMVRGAMLHTKTTDFIVFLALGMLHTWEGTLFSTSYYLSFIQFVVLLGWFSTINWRPYTAIVVASGFIYCGILTRVGEWQGLEAHAINDLVIAVLVAAFSGFLAAFFRSYWQDLNQKLLRKQLEDNARLIDLGRHLGIICHDIGNSLCTLRYSVVQLEEMQGKGRDHSLESTVTQLSKATNHIETIQRFVLGIARKDTRDIVWTQGRALREFVQTMTHDICWEARPNLYFNCDESLYYRCSPPALAFAVINAVNNSARASRRPEGGFIDGFRIDVTIGRTDDGEMRVTVRDNGPGFPKTLLPNLFKDEIPVASLNGSGLGLQNMLRYISHQGGQVQGRNAGGAVVEFTIPQN